MQHPARVQSSAAGSLDQAGGDPTRFEFGAESPENPLVFEVAGSAQQNDLSSGCEPLDTAAQASSGESGQSRK